MTERWTVSKLAASATELLQKKGFESPRLEADLLLAHALGMQRMDLYTRFDMPVDDEPRAQFRELIRRRLTHEPIAYILGSRDFMDWSVDVERGVLIPRPETEHLVTTALAGLSEDGAHRIVEVGIGSGCLLLSILKERPKASGLGLDIEATPLRVSTKNARKLGLEERFDAVESDRFAALEERPDWRGQLQLIVSNPPYIRPEERANLAPDVRDFEPAAALFHAGDGLEFHRQLLVDGTELLADEGFFVLELPGEGGAILRSFLAERLPDFVSAVLPDYAGLDRVFIAKRRTFGDDLLRHLEANRATF